MKLYEIYLSEKEDEVNIHPKRKTFSSVALLANPLDDIVFGSIGGGAAVKTMKNASKLTKFGSFAGGVITGAALSAALIAAYRKIRSWFDDCTKTCGTFKVNVPKRQLCMLNCKKLSMQKQISLLQKNKVDPDKINKAINNLKVINQKILLYNQYLRKTGNK